MPPETLPSAIVGFDHVALPLGDPEGMIAFYQALGLKVKEGEYVVQVYIGNQMINFHRPELWRGDFALRAPAATPPCGDLCFVWDGPADALTHLLHQAGAHVEEGPIEREGGRRSVGSSIYVRDPDGNLLEFLTYRGKEEGVS